MYGPVIPGQLLRLRPPTLDDALNMTSWFEDLEVIRFLDTNHPPSVDMEREWIATNAKDPSTIIWVIEVEGRAVGASGIHEINWREGHGKTGTVIADKALWGQGIGGELMRLRTEYAFTHTPLRKLHSSYVDGNEASARAQAAAGYREVGRYRKEKFDHGKWVDLVLTEVLREDWEKLRSV